jgi:hypothetical protein
MQLKHYPTAIATAQTELNRIKKAIRQTKDLIAKHELPIDKAILFDPELKNEGQRKLARAERIQTDEHLPALYEYLNNLTDGHDAAEVELNAQISRFTVAKLERRQTIAQMETEARLSA